ncbi:hypothetical protein BGZ60DRAFT_569086 [Tricladium varicosporioides]|nr:hypothetical protein BGZ60DRAFT_569086 [Hymenoscyphus varicosporioides]
MSLGSCPNGGTWQECTSGSNLFFGCCTSNACSGGCPSSDLRAAGLGTAAGPNFPSNEGSPWPNERCSTGLWWTCAVQTPTFQGCCDSNPCNGVGCPSSQLHAAAFASTPISAGSKASSSTISSSSPTKQTTSTPQLSSRITPGITPTGSTATPKTISDTLQITPTQVTSVVVPISGTSTASGSIQTQTQVPTSSAKTSSTIPIAVGAAVGIVVLAALVAFIIWFLCRRRRLRKPDENHTPPEPSAQVETSENLGGEAKPVVRANTYEAYYPGRPIFGVDNNTSGKLDALHSPGLQTDIPNTPNTPAPPYRNSIQAHSSHNSLQLHEMDSPSASRLKNSDSPTVAQLDSTPVHEMHQSPEPRNSEMAYGLVIASGARESRASELSSTKSVVARKLVGGGNSGRAVVPSSPEQDNERTRKATGQGYTDWQTLNP